MKQLKIMLLSLCLMITQISFSTIIYHDNFDGVYPYTTTLTSYYFDINNDGQSDIQLQLGRNNLSPSSYTCNGISSTVSPVAIFGGVSNSFGQNSINGISAAGSNWTNPTIDCTNDTLNILDIWSNGGIIYKGTGNFNASAMCINIGFTNHKQGFRLIKTNPANGTLGYIYGYIDYTVSNTGDIIIHGWYYEDQFNVPIACNSLLDYPYDGNCIHYDTIQVYDTIITNINVYDTIQVYDTIINYISVTDTLFINSTLDLNQSYSNVLKIYPNPTSTNITIDNGNYNNMLDLTIYIENSLGQTLFIMPINQPLFVIDVSTWVDGIYYVKIIDNQSNILCIKKIIFN